MGHAIFILFILPLAIIALSLLILIRTKRPNKGE